MQSPVLTSKELAVLAEAIMGQARSHTHMSEGDTRLYVLWLPFKNLEKDAFWPIAHLDKAPDRLESAGMLKNDAGEA